MTEENTVQVNPSELSDEVVQELVEEGEIPKDEAEEWGDRVWVDEAMEDNSEKMSALEYLDNRFERFNSVMHFVGVMLKNMGVGFVDGLNRFTVDKVDLLRNKKTVVAVVEDVAVDSESENVALSIQHDWFGSGEVSLGLDSTALSNLLDYKSVDNPMDLEGGSVFVLPQSFDESSQTVLIPHNVSLSGKVRFKFFGVVEEVREKTRIRGMFRSFGDRFEGLLWTGLLMLWAMAAQDLYASPSLLSTVIGGVMWIPPIYFAYWIAISIVSFVLRSNFIEVKTR